MLKYYRKTEINNQIRYEEVSYSEAEKLSLDGEYIFCFSNRRNKKDTKIRQIFDDTKDSIKTTYNELKDNIELSQSSRKRQNRLLKVLPYLNEQDIHELIESELNKDDSFELINIESLLPFLNTSDCDKLFIRAIKDGNNKLKPETITKYISEECIHVVAVLYLNDEILNFDIESMYPYMSSSDIKKIVVKIMSE